MNYKDTQGCDNNCFRRLARIETIHSTDGLIIFFTHLEYRTGYRNVLFITKTLLLKGVDFFMRFL